VRGSPAGLGARLGEEGAARHGDRGAAGGGRGGGRDPGSERGSCGRATWGVTERTGRG